MNGDAIAAERPAQRVGVTEAQYSPIFEGGSTSFDEFVAEPFEVPSGQSTPVRLRRAASCSGRLGSSDEGGITFNEPGRYEVLMTVEWDPESTSGNRFSHTRVIPDEHPFHSEAIAAAVLSEVSEGKQLLRGNSAFDELNELRLEMWKDSGGTVAVRRAAIVVRMM